MKRVCCVGVDSFYQLQMTFFFFLLPSFPSSLGTFFPQQLLALTLSLLSRSLLPRARLPPCMQGWQRSHALLKVGEGEFLALLQDFTLLLMSYGNVQILALVLALV